jgi:hypothetical protein
MVLFFGLYLKDRVLDIQQAEYSRQEGHKLAPGDDLIENEDKADEKKKRTQEGGAPVDEDSRFHRD